MIHFARTQQWRRGWDPPRVGGDLSKKNPRPPSRLEAVFCCIIQGRRHRDRKCKNNAVESRAGAAPTTDVPTAVPSRGPFRQQLHTHTLSTQAVASSPARSLSAATAAPCKRRQSRPLQLPVRRDHIRPLLEPRVSDVKVARCSLQSGAITFRRCCSPTSASSKTPTAASYSACCSFLSSRIEFCRFFRPGYSDITVADCSSPSARTQIVRRCSSSIRDRCNLHSANAAAYI